jgi:hypothetical protein
LGVVLGSDVVLGSGGAGDEECGETAQVVEEEEEAEVEAVEGGR